LAGSGTSPGNAAPDAGCLPEREEQEVLSRTMGLVAARRRCPCSHGTGPSWPVDRLMHRA
jgi:hypothetical protein